MRAAWCASQVLVVCFAGMVRADDQTEAKVILDKALKAMGGEAKVAPFKTGVLKSKLTYKDRGRSAEALIDVTWRGINQCRFDWEASGEKITRVVNGDKGWAKSGSIVRETGEDQRTADVLIINVLYAVRMPQFLPGLKDKECKLSLLGETKVNDKAAVGLSIAHKDFKNVSLYFDKESGLLAKAQIKLTALTRDINIECLFGEYKELEDVKHPTKVTVKIDGEEGNLEIREIKAKDKVDDAEFAKP